MKVISADICIYSTQGRTAEVLNEFFERMVFKGPSKAPQNLLSSENRRLPHLALLDGFRQLAEHQLNGPARHVHPVSG